MKQLLSLALCLALQWGRGPLAAPGALSLVFDLALAILAGLSLSEQWRPVTRTLLKLGVTCTRTRSHCQSR